MCDTIKLSSLGKTWLFDIDGTICKHNGYKIDGEDTLLDGAKEFINSLSLDDKIIMLTSRTEDQASFTEDFLRKNGIRYDSIVYGLPYGERILINDKKPSGLNTAIAINTDRDVFCGSTFDVDLSL